MKLSGVQAAAFCRSPDPALAGALLHGDDEGAVAACRRELVQTLLGGGADAMQIERLDAGAVRRDPAALDAALRARGFFGGRGVVLVEGATDTLAAALEPVLTGAEPGDAFLVVTAGSLPGKSSLRRLFEADKLLISLHDSRGSCRSAGDRVTPLGVGGGGRSDGGRTAHARLAGE